ncbi:TRAP transporter small permease [Tropicimonas sp. IMCC6043]|uniref:TRAP transporter small permease n=1 Tax=Tropicimonas sp. IMCC6043 TaxID=2510645 RepID=UPI00101C1833|nr:TRAP transporter small permease [Tropicimonas sp. IMCC6043]RYH06495.1 TRAP transporter small permease [Tropicimonas sp. IMCC6043]
MNKIALRASRLLTRTTETVATLLLIVVTCLNLTQVGGRYLFNTGFSWTEEAMRYLMIWLMMLGSVACIFRAEHMGIQTLENMVRPERARLVKSALYTIAAIFCVFVLVYGWPLTLRNARQVAPASQIPMILPYMALPVGAALMLLQIALTWFSGFEPDTDEIDRGETLS